MASAKPTQPPALDAANMVKGGTPAAQKFPEWKRWVEGSGSQDGKGLRDVVNANALHLDAVEQNLNQHKAADNERHQALAERVSALEAAGSSDPFPVSG